MGRAHQRLTPSRGTDDIPPLSAPPREEIAVGPALIALATVEGGSESVLLVEEAARRAASARSARLCTENRPGCCGARNPRERAGRPTVQQYRDAQPVECFDLARTAISRWSRLKVLLTSGSPKRRAMVRGAPAVPNPTVVTTLRARCAKAWTLTGYGLNRKETVQSLNMSAAISSRTTSRSSPCAAMRSLVSATIWSMSPINRRRL